MRFIRILEAVTRKEWEPNQLRVWDMKVGVVLTMLEISLPVFWNTICKHLLHHVFSPTGSIARCGPFCACSMMPGERNHTQLKQCCRGRKNMQLSICRYYGQRQVQNASGDGDEFVNSAADVAPANSQSTQITKHDLKPPPYLSIEYVAKVSGYPVRTATLSTAMYGQVLDLFSIENQSFRRLLRMYRNDCSRGRYHGDISQWRPRAPARALNDSDLSLLAFTPNVRFYRRATLNGLVFTATDHERSNARTFRSGVKQQYVESETGERKWAYGVIDRIFEYQFPGMTDPDVIVDCTWMKTLHVDEDTELTVVEDSQAHPWNSSCPITYLRHCRPAHILYWPVDLVGDEHPGQFYVIDRGNEYYQY